METWQVDWITKHSVELQRYTRCTVRLLTALQSKEILDWDEVTELDDEVRTSAKVKKFYLILMTKSCYDILIEELGNCRQTGAEEILREGKAQHESRMNDEGTTDEEMNRGQSQQKRFVQGPEGLQDFLTSKDSKVLLISTLDVGVTMSKIRDNLDVPLVIAENKRHLRASMLEYTSEAPKLFVFRCAEPPDAEFVAKFAPSTSNGAKAILLTKHHRLSRLENTATVKTSRDTLHWTDLKYWFQEELLEKQVETQVGGERLRVREILQESQAEEELEDEKLILNLINNQAPALFRAPPDQINYYIQRKIRSRFVFNKNDTFFRESKDKETLFSESNFILDLDEHKFKYDYHPLIIADGPGMGKSTLLQSLASQILEKWPGEKTVFFIAFSDLVNSLKANTRNSSGVEVSTEMFENALLQLTTECGPELGKCVLKSMLRSTSNRQNVTKVELMLDGYDEVNTDDLKLAKKIFALIRNSYHSTRIWVATRPHRIADMEDELPALGFAMLPFDESDKVNLLVEFWQSEKIEEEGSSNCPNIRPDLVKFARHCLENVKQIGGKNAEKEDICGVPLQCLLIAKIYLDDCLSFTNRDKLTTNSPPLLSFKVTSIKDLYEALIQKKLQIYTERYAKQNQPEMKTMLLNVHYYFALQLLFPKYAPVFKVALTFGDVPTKDILDVGIVESAPVELKDSPICLGHRTIPEFLVALFVAEQLCEDERDSAKKVTRMPISTKDERPPQTTRFTNHDIGNLLIDGMLRTLTFQAVIHDKPFELEKFENQTLAFFLDSFLQGRAIDNSTKIAEIVRGRSRPVAACVFGEHLHLFKALKSGYEHVGSTILVAAVAETSKPFLEYICNEHVGNMVKTLSDSKFFGVAQFFDQLAKVRQQLNDIHKDATTHPVCIPPKIIEEISTFKNEFPVQEAKFRSKLASTLSLVGAGANDMIALEECLKEFQSGPYSPERLTSTFETWGDVAEKVAFAKSIVQHGAKYIGFQCSLDDEMTKNIQAKAFVLFFKATAKASQPDVWKKNRQVFFEEVKKGGEHYFAVDCDIHNALWSKSGEICLKVFQNRRVLSENLVIEREESLSFAKTTTTMEKVVVKPTKTFMERLIANNS